MKQLLIILTFVATIFAGNPCSEVNVINDPFEGNQVMEGKSLIYLDYLNTIRFRKVNDSIYMVFRLVDGGDINQILPEGSSIKFAFSNDEIVEFNTDTETIPVTAARGYNIETTWELAFPIAESVVALFKDEELTALKVPNVKNGEDININLINNRLSLRNLEKQVEAMLCADCCE